MKEKFKVTGMTCSACSSRVEKTVDKLEGTDKVMVNLLTGSMQVEFDEEKITAEAICRAAVLPSAVKCREKAHRWMRRPKQRR